MAHIKLRFSDDSIALECRTLRGSERLGEPTELSIEAIGANPVDPVAVLGLRCEVDLDGVESSRTLAGTVTSFTCVATSNRDSQARRYRFVVRSSIAVLSLRRQVRVFQHLTAPAIVRKVLEDAMFASDAIVERLSGEHPELEYVVQYDETDLELVRRICEENGLYFRTTMGESGEQLVLEDSSSTSERAVEEALPVVDATGLRPHALAVVRPRLTLRRRVGKVTLRDYDHERPALDLTVESTGGPEVEQQEVEVYAAPGGYKTPSEGERRARERLEALRADADVLRFESNALSLAPGLLVELSSSADLRGLVRPEGEYFVVETHLTLGERDDLRLEVVAIPAAVPYRLPRVTPKPVLFGLHSARVTGASGKEIHVDDQGRVRVKFHWDRAEEDDDRTSLPIRVMHPNTPESMLLPRVGWEVLVAFEDGDPDRPYVLGRAYNGKHMPPYGLPANKTVTVFGTQSSPGGGRQNQIRFDDAAGRQNISFGAGFAKNTNVASNMVTQTVKNEGQTIKASQARTVGADEKVSSVEAYLVDVASQSATVGGMQKVTVAGDQNVGVGSETILIGGACLEKVGNPVTGAMNLGKAAALQGASALGAAGGALATAFQLGEAGYRGYQKGGLEGAVEAVAGAGAGMVADRLVPGGATVVGAIQELAAAPWSDAPPGGGADAAGGGATAAGDAGGPSGPGPGHRNTSTQGVATEIVGGAVSMASPGSINWSTIGVSTVMVGGSHNLRAGQAGARTLGASNETLGSLSVTVSGDITRDITGPITNTIGGSLTSKSGAKHSIKAGGALTLKVGGGVKLDAPTISFIVGGSVVTADGQGILLKASNIKITGATKQKGPTGHS